MRTLMYSFAAALVLVGILTGKAYSQAGTAIRGWAWSDTVGWVSLNCLDVGTCGTVSYGLSYDNTTGTVSGYAWSEHVGWISAQSADLAGCPSGLCAARFSGSSLTGWFKALTAADGWDGWISLSGAQYQTQRVNEYITGYAWGSDVVGWVDFSSAQPCAATAGNFCSGSTQMYRDGQCAETVVEVCSYGCAADIGICIPPPAPTGNIQALPSLVIPGDTVQVSWDTDDTVSCSVASIGSGGASGGSVGSFTSLPLNLATTFTLSCDGLAPGLELTDTVTVLINPQWREQ